MDNLYTYVGRTLNVSKKLANCKLVAHAGLFTDGVVQNTIAAYKKAIDNGFEWLEIDTRNSIDNVYVMSHNDTVTLYRNGTPSSITISTTEYDDFCDMTWDANGVYRICTLESVFRSLRLYKVGFVLDKKAGSNSDLVDIAARCGVLDKIMLSYGSFLNAYNDRELLNKYPCNQTFADTNVVGLNNYTFTTPLAYNIPFLFSGCELSLKEKWAPLASGCLFGSNVTYDQMKEALDIDFDISAKITVSSASESIGRGQAKTITASSSADTMAGYVYGFVVDPEVAPCKQMAFGKNASFEVYGRTAGNTILRLFTPCGTRKDVAITIS